MGKFDEYVYELPRRPSACGDVHAEPSVQYLGNESQPGSNLTMGFTVIRKETLESFPHFHHSIEEYLMFSGQDLCNFFDFDAEIELWIGKDLNNMEKHVITKPTIVRIPPYTWHCPLEYKRVGKPVYFQLCGTRGKFGTFSYSDDGDGEYHIRYVGSAGAKKCVYDENKQCVFCGKCWKQTLTDGNLRAIAERFSVTPREGWLD